MLKPGRPPPQPFLETVEVPHRAFPPDGAAREIPSRSRPRSLTGGLIFEFGPSPVEFCLRRPGTYALTTWCFRYFPLPSPPFPLSPKPYVRLLRRSRTGWNLSKIGRVRPKTAFRRIALSFRNPVPEDVLVPSSRALVPPLTTRTIIKT